MCMLHAAWWCMCMAVVVDWWWWWWWWWCMGPCHPIGIFGFTPEPKPRRDLLVSHLGSPKPLCVKPNQPCSRFLRFRIQGCLRSAACTDHWSQYVLFGHPFDRFLWKQTMKRRSRSDCLKSILRMWCSRSLGNRGFLHSVDRAFSVQVFSSVSRSPQFRHTQLYVCMYVCMHVCMNRY
jgi:hypothetical protein